MKYAIIIPSGGGDRLDVCLGTIDPEIRKNVLIYKNAPGIEERDDVLGYGGSGVNDGVSAGWNFGVQYVIENKLDYLIILSQHVVFTGGMRDFIAELDKKPKYGIITPEGWHCIALSRKTLELVGEFDTNYYPIYYEDCLAPETRVLTADLRWETLDKISVGDKLVGVDEYTEPSQQRRYRPSEVLSMSRKPRECYKISFTNGTSVISSENHPWLARPYEAKAGNSRWVRTNELKTTHAICTPLNVWDDATSFREGWLSGVLDGEGHIHKSGKGTDVQVSQLEGKVYEEIKSVLNDMGILYTSRVRQQKNHKNPIGIIEISVRKYSMELLGRLRPLRLLNQSQKIWDGMAFRGRTFKNQFVKIESIEKIGLHDTIGMSTTTGTFLANGMVSHNTDYELRLYKSGIIDEIVEVPLKSLETPGGYSTTLGLRPNVEKCKEYFIQKWGNVFSYVDYEHQIFYDRPFNNPNNALDYFAKKSTEQLIVECDFTHRMYDLYIESVRDK